MSAPIEFRYRCASELCKADFSLNQHERYSKARARCPACGSLHYEPKLGGEKFTTALSMLAGSHSSTHSPSLDKRLQVPARKSAAAQKRHEHMQWMMSAPTRYRAVALKNNYERFKAKRDKDAKKAERLRREKDWTPLK